MGKKKKRKEGQHVQFYYLNVHPASAKFIKKKE